MLCDQTFKFFHTYFSISYMFGFVCFKWDTKRRHFHKQINTTDWQVTVWKINNFVLLAKVIFLVAQSYFLNQTKLTTKLILVYFFLLSLLCPLIHNVLFWKTGNGVPVLYSRSVTFSNEACGKLNC